MTVRCVLHSGILFSSRSLRQTVILLVFSCVGFLHAQGALTTRGQGASVSGGMDAQDGAAVSPTSAETAVPSCFGRAGTPPSGSFSGSAFWNDLLLDAFQLGVRSGNLSGPSGGGTSFNGGGQGYSGGVTSQSGGQPNRAVPGGNPADLDSLFRMASGLSRDLGAGKHGALGTALGVLPAFSQLTGGGLNLSSKTSVGNFRLSYRDLLSGAMGGRPGLGSPSASFTSSHVRTGKVDFSAAASVSDGSMSGGSGMSAGMSSFGSQSSGMSSFGSTAGSGSASAGGSQAGGRPSGGPAGSAPGGSGGSSGGKHPTAAVSLRLNF
jgi:hypothetical protein